MQGDFSRLTFRPERDYRSVLLQQGRVLLDADWNEQAELTAYRDDVRTHDLLGEHGGFAGQAGFAVVDADGRPPAGARWQDLGLTAGPYYVQGVRCVARGSGDHIPLAAQPYLPGADPAEPQGDGAQLLYLDVWTRQVTADEDPVLREPALGGPDTTTRAQTVWQVRVRPVGTPAEVVGSAANTMVAALAPAVDAAAGTSSAAGGYTLLDNQLYRVQIHAPTPERPMFLWSRENGSVVAGLDELVPAAGSPDHDAELVVDRVGRDVELSIGPDAVVEVTSRDRELRGEPGFLAVVTVPDGPRLRVRWLDPDHVPADLAGLGGYPVVRRWDGPPQAVSPEPTDLEGGIRVAFPGRGYRTGDHWLVPARAVRLSYGLPAATGTIDWPVGPDGQGRALPPHGPVHRTAPLAILSRSTQGWQLDADLRQLAPTLTELLSLDLLDGDAQESAPGMDLPRPVRVAVRNGGRPVAGVPITFEPAGGTVDGRSGPVPIPTDDSGIAAATWRLDPDGAVAQTLTARWRNGAAPDVRPAVVATGRLDLRQPGRATVTVNAQLVSDLDNTPAWQYSRGTSKAPAGAQVKIGGWMPVVLPHRYRIVSLRVICTKAPGATIKAQLFRQPLDGQSNEVIGFDIRDQTPQPFVGTVRESAVAQGFDLINSSVASHYVHVALEKADGTEMIAFQVICEPLPAGGGG